MTADKTLFLVTLINQQGGEDVERLVRAPSRHAAQTHVIGINKASADDVARVLAAGGKVEEVA